MSFVQAISTVFKKYADFTGVARRSEYWWWVLFSVLVSLVLTGIDSAINNGSGGIGFLSLIWSLATLLPSLAVGVRRLRDAGYGWGFLFLALIPLVGAIALIVMLAQPTKVTTSAGYAQPTI
jgi:uncharacterized membrane protein YhaH (DUF805 family)